MNALDRVLHARRRHAGEAVQRRGRVAVGERSERDRRARRTRRAATPSLTTAAHGRPLPSREQSAAMLTRATTSTNSGSASSLATRRGAEHERCAERDEVAGYVGSERPCKPRKPAVSTKPPVKLKRAASTWFRITASSGPARPREPPVRSLQRAGRCHAPRRRSNAFSRSKCSYLTHKIRPGGRRSDPAFCRRLWPKRYINAVPPR